MQRTFTRIAAATLIALSLGSGTAIAQTAGGGPNGGPGGTPGTGQTAGAPKARMLQRCDTNGDGAVSEEEFRTCRAALFDAIDTNHDGVVTREELTQFFAANGANRVDRMMARLDPTGSGSVSRQQFIDAGMRRFHARDTNGDGQLTLDELSAGKRGGMTKAPPAAAQPPVQAPSVQVPSSSTSTAPAQ